MGYAVHSTLLLVLTAAGVVALLWGLMVLQVRRLRWRPMRTRLLERDAMPATDRVLLDQARASLRTMGFEYRCSGATEKALVSDGDVWVYSDIYQHRDGHTHAVLTPSPLERLRQPCQLSLVSCFEDGRNWLTVNCHRHYMLPVPPQWQVFDDYLPGWPDVLAQHLTRVQAAVGAVVTDTSAVQARMRAMSEGILPHWARRGGLVPHGDAGVFQMGWWAALRCVVVVQLGKWRAAKVQASPAAGAHGDATSPSDVAAQADARQEADARAFAEVLSHRRSKPTSAGRKWIVLALSAALFVLVGGWWNGWSFVAVLLAVVALHEGGHYLAMRLTGYQNVSVFFIPGIGGMAMGEKPSATPMELLLVYLAGPVPGMLLAGLALWGAAHGVFHPPGWLHQFVWVSLAINYINLMPITPLDGGRVLDAFLFARLPVLRFAFAALCCGVLLAFGVWLGDVVLWGVALVVAWGLPYQWRVMRLSSALHSVAGRAWDEVQSLQQIARALQQPAFSRWSFDQRSTTAIALLPHLQGRRARLAELVLGLGVYTTCLIAPVAGLWFAVPQLGEVAALFLPWGRPPADELDAEPPAPAATAPIDWSLQLSNVASLPMEKQLEVYLGAAVQAENGEGYDAARGHFASAWALAQALPAGDARRIDALLGMARTADSEAQARTHLQQVLTDIPQAQGAQRLQLAQAKVQLAYQEESAAVRVTLLKDALALHQAEQGAQAGQSLETQLALARALDADGDTAAARAELEQRISAVPLPDAPERTRQALERRIARVQARVELVWFLIEHQHAAQARAIALQALQEVPAKVTVAWSFPVQQLLEARLWVDLEAGQVATLPDSLRAWEEALRLTRYGAPQPMSYALDKALVAEALGDEALRASAHHSVKEALNKRFTQHLPSLCQEPRATAWPNWRGRQQEARRRMLAQMGGCDVASQ